LSRVTIAEVASAAGVSKTAVSFAFNAPDRLSSGTRDRIHRVAAELGYLPHPTARALSIRRSGSIGLLIPQSLTTVFANPFISELIRGLGEVFERHDLALLLVPPLNGSLEEAMRRAAVDGFISVGLSANDRALETLERMRVPAVFVDSDAPAGGVAVNVDDAAGAEAAATHLLGLGHRDLALIVLPPARAEKEVTPVVARRLAGYRAAVDAAGAPEPLLLRAEATLAAGAAAFEALATRRPRPTAVLAMSDMAALGVIDAARAAGVAVPEELSVVGYDDVPVAAWSTPPLTTVRQPTAAKARLAAELLIAQMTGRRADSPAPLPTELVIRGTTAQSREVVAGRA
jgi:alanine racemase